MARLNPYKAILNLDSVDDVANIFIATLVTTNMTYDYFVDWDKVKKRVTDLNVEINILNSLIGSQNVADDFSELIPKYPEVLPVIPLIIAVRADELQILEAPERIRSFSFKKKSGLSKEEIAEILYFCQKTGMLALFSDIKLKSLKDYLLGVEVGMDTNARKNRSGSSMESIILPMLVGLQESYEDLEIVSQKQFKRLKTIYDVEVPEALKERKFDFVLKRQNLFINIEANYYSGAGSKPQEIVDSYINRQNELRNAGWYFIWITDGPGWRTGLNQIKVGFDKVDYLLNLNFAKKGLLQEILKEL